MNVRKRIALALIVLSSLAASAPAADDPRGIVEKLTSEVIAVLKKKGLSADEKRKQIEPIIFSYTDFDTTSRLVLARHWPKLSEAEQQAFVDEFKKHLSITYGKNVDSYRDEKVTITDERKEARGDSTVKTRIIRDGPNDILVDYRLRQVSGGWKIIDVIIERVSLVSNFRSQFQDIMASGGIDRLLALLREKNAKGESLKTS